MHTPGPWIADEERRGSIQIFNGYVGFMVAEVPVTPDNIEERSVQLILAAPAMLEALKEIEWIFDGKEDITDNGGPNDAMRALTAIRAAIAKATHEERISRRDA